MPDETGTQLSRQSRRTKRLDVYPLPEDRYRFVSELIDESFGGWYEDGGDSVTVHHFVVEGIVSDDLTLVELTANAVAHPFPQCPGVLPAVDGLAGCALDSGWRRSVLDAFRGTRGCTHLTTALLGLSELITLIYFQRQNRQAAYGPESRASGQWIAGNLESAPSLAGACHALSEDGEVIAQARHQLSIRPTD
ncbi:DUF2889 domain-containing protein [Gordonia terrae]